LSYHATPDIAPFHQYYQNIECEHDIKRV
jgi:hypothetical protein